MTLFRFPVHALQHDILKVGVLHVSYNVDMYQLAFWICGHPTVSFLDRWCRLIGTENLQGMICNAGPILTSAGTAQDNTTLVSKEGIDQQFRFRS